MTALRERIADKSRYDDWRRDERCRAIDAEEDKAREIAGRIASIKAQVVAFWQLSSDLVDGTPWEQAIDWLDGAEKILDAHVKTCKAASTDVAQGE